MATLPMCRYGGYQQYRSMLLIALRTQKHRRCSIAFFDAHHPAQGMHGATRLMPEGRSLGSAAVKALPRRRAAACVFVCVLAVRLKQRLQTFAFALECHTKVAEIDAAIEARESGRTALRAAVTTAVRTAALAAMVQWAATLQECGLITCHLPRCTLHARVAAHD